MVGKKLSHYTIQEEIGRGGMGVVYRAHDDQLDRDVAIKVLTPGSLSDEAAQKRFRTEALSLARLNHPNIATVHEFGSEDGIDFLVTEYIAGSMLDASLARGALPISEVVRLGTQLADGLAAAHEQGIVHRDLKPANLRLTGDGRLKILDFGLAQFAPRASEAGKTVTMTGASDVMGTLPYMAPEQLSGEMPDARTDIWSAGAVLYEMATGKRPFAGKTQALLINSILTQSPQSPRKHNAEVTAELDAVILKALARDRAARYQNAAGLRSDLTGPTAGISGPIAAGVQGGSPWWWIALAVAVMVAAAAGYLLLHRGQALKSTGANRRRTVAVMGFKNLSGNPEKAWLSTALSEMLTTDLSQGDQLRTIPGESVAMMKASLALPEADSFSRETLGRIRQNVGSDDVIVGSYVPVGDGQLRVDLRLQDAATGETLGSISEKGNESEIDSIVNKVGGELRAKLGAEPLSDAQSALVRASLPSNPEAARLYSQGLQRLRWFDALKARDLLEKATELDPNHAPTHSALAEAWSILGYDSKAKEQAKQALELSSRFSKEERELIEGRAHEVLGESAKAVESYRSLWEFFPDNVDYALFLIRSQVAAGRGEDAVRVLADLRKLNVSGADAARIDLAEASVASSLSDFKRDADLAGQAVEKGKTVGANLVVAQALALEADALERMGEAPQKTIALTNEARELYLAAGDRRAAARTLLSVGDALYDEGDYEGAKRQFEDALPVFREVGAEKSIRATEERIGNVHYSQGKLLEAKSDYEEALRYDREINDPFGLSSDYGNLANVLDGLGDLQGALKMQLDSLDAFNAIGDRRGASATLNNLGNLFVEMGNLGEARKYFDQSLAMTREIAYRRGEPYPMAGIGDTMLYGGDLAGARKQYEQTVAMCQEMKDEDFLAQQKVGLAFISLNEKKYSDGAALARDAAGQYEKTNSTNAVWAEAILARNLLAAGSVEESKIVVAKAADVAKQAAGQAPRYEVAMAEARVKAKTGKADEGRKELEAALASARKFGYRTYEYQIRLAMVEIEMASGAAAAKSQLRDLERDARAHGALLVANQARALAQGSGG